jgi:hypothetical protein
MLAVFFSVFTFQGMMFAQNIRTDGGLIVTEDSLLSLNNKKLLFVVAQNILQPTRVEVQTVSSEGIVNHFTPIQFPQGLKRGQVIPIWNGELNGFYTTPWLYFQVTMFTASETYYTQTMFPVNYREQYKEPMITSIAETGGYGVPYTITAQGIFDTTEPSLILINTNVFVSPKVVTQRPPGIIQFNVDSNTTNQFPPGKYLLTICQAWHCDTLEGRHR